MNRIILIPVAGTLAAVVAVALARGEKDSDKYPILREPSSQTATEERRDLDPPENKTDKKPVEPVRVAPRRYLMEVREDGSFSVTAVTRDKNAALEPVEHESLEKFMEAAKPDDGTRPTIHLFKTSPKVSIEDLEKVAEQLRVHFEVMVQK